MSEPFQELADLDRLIHEPSRLSLLTALSACDSADFLYLQRLTGLTKGNLSSHIAKLEATGLVLVHKAFVQKTPVTRIEITALGRETTERHWQRLATLRRRVLRWEPDV